MRWFLASLLLLEDSRYISVVAAGDSRILPQLPAIPFLLLLILFVPHTQQSQCVKYVSWIQFHFISRSCVNQISIILQINIDIYWRSISYTSREQSIMCSNIYLVLSPLSEQQIVNCGLDIDSHHLSLTQHLPQN